ncbi:MAG: 2-amino-4-hydroxy-6-hydroxymethyldihydropteridine diphosphokinase [Dehalococcoidia bacterium]|nr:2-amino-4-hydroxy-6-hydroxymethyldihydropteridine diphosphokinase [Dehalococcoidia bacterium]
MALINAFLGLGSNLGSREESLARGLALLAGSLQVVETSSIYETEPWGFTEQPPFLNMVCRVRAGIPPNELLLLCQEVERQVGRQPTFRYGPRVLDIDILDYGGTVVTSPALALPHPLLAERAFVLVPLAEIAPEWEHPVLRKRAWQLLEEVSGRGGVRLWAGPLAVASGD